MTDSGVAAEGSARRPTVLNLCRVLWNGGVQRAAIAQTLELRRRGYDCDLRFLRRVPGSAYELPAGTQVGEPRGPGQGPALAVLSRAVTRRFAAHRGVDASVDLDLLWEARHDVRRHELTLYNDQYGGVLGVAGRLVGGRPFVMMFHEFYPRAARGLLARILAVMAGAWDHIAILTAPAIVTTSSGVQDRIERFAPGRTFLARLGAPAPKPRRPVSSRDRRSVFSITVWDRGRHPETFLDLARAMPAFTFVVAGMWTDPIHLAEFRRKAEGLSNLQVTGVLSETDRVQLQGRSLLYLRLGYRESGPGMGGLEALSEGSIVLVNPGLGLSELIEDGRTGFRIPAPDAGAVRSTLERIDRLSEQTLQEISDAALDLAARWSWQAHGEVLERALAMARGGVIANPEASLPTGVWNGAGSAGHGGSP